jgi:hypothetical protein
MSDEGAIKEGISKGNSIFKLDTLKQIAKKTGLIIGLPKPEMIVALRSAVARASELKGIEALKRDGTYTMEKNYFPRLINLVLRYPDALQRSSALATRQDLQNKEVNGTKLIWVTVVEEFMNGTDSGGLVQEHEEFSKLKINPAVISKSGTTTPQQTHDDSKMLVKEYCKVCGWFQICLSS